MARDSGRFVGKGEVIPSLSVSFGGKFVGKFIPGEPFSP
jgi:hypothetical protein